MPNTFVLRQSALQDGTVLRSGDTFAPDGGGAPHGTMAKASLNSTRRRPTLVEPNPSGVRSFPTDVVNATGTRGARRTVQPMESGGIRRKPDEVQPNQDHVIRRPSKVEVID